MITIAHDIITCTPEQAVARLPWDNRAGWGFLVVRHDNGRLYGSIGPVDSDQPGLGLPLGDEADLTRAVGRLVLAAGLSIIARAGLELGGALVVAGSGPLAQTVLASAQAQGARTACILRDASAEATPLPACAYIDYANLATFDAALDRFVAAGPGRVAFVDALGDPEVALAMAKRVPQYGYLVFCRPDATSSLMLNIRQVHHLKSAHYVYWSRPETLVEALHFVTYIERAQRLMIWERVRLPERG
jgi:hypothetical protein